MKSLSQSGGNYKPSRKKTISLALLICLIFVSLLSVAFILTHADHMHDHNGIGSSCTACVQMQNAENLLRLLGTAAATGVTSFAGYYAAIAFIRIICSDITALTPIEAKTRINN